MKPREAGAVHRGDAILERVENGLKCAMVFLLIPAAMAVHGNLPFARWVVAPLVLALALWLLVMLVIALGQRFGVVGTRLLQKPLSVLDDSLEITKREQAPIVRRAGDAPPPGGADVTQAAGVHPAHIHVAHIPGRGDVRYRFATAGERR